MTTQTLEKPKPAPYGDETEFLTRKQLMALLNVGKSWTDEALKGDNPIPSIRRGKTRRYPKQAALRWFNTGDAG